MPVLKEKYYTIEDIYALPDGKRMELIDGILYDMAPPTRTHQRVVGELFALIREYIKKNGGSCEVNVAPFAVFLENDDFTYVEPDISVVCNPEKLDDKGCHGAPDWVIEIVSKSSKQMDYFTKLFKYQNAGVREYWIVDPEKMRITVYNFASEEIMEFTWKDKVKAGIYPDLFIDFAEIESKW